MSFRERTRQNFTDLPTQQYSAGNRIYFELPKVGLLSSMILTFQATATISGGTPTVKDAGAYGLIKRIRLIANSGASIFDVSGYGCYLINCLDKYGFDPKSSPLDRSIGSEIYNLPTATGTLRFSLNIPIAVNERDAIGLLMLQNNATQLVLEVEFATDVTGAYTLGAATVALSNSKVGLNMEYFTLPREQKDYPAINNVHQWLEQQDSVVSSGAWTKSLLRGNTYMRMIHYVTLNGALNTTDIDKLRILYNQAEQPYVISKQAQLFLQRKRYGYDLPKGTFVHDWYYSNGQPGLGDSRDFINSAAVTEFQTEITIATGATLGAGNNFVNTLTQQLIQIA